MKKADRIAVCSRSFSRNAVLREELLKRYEHVTFNEKGQHLCGNKLVEFLSGHDKAIIGLEKITNNVLCKLPRLKVISKYGVGLDMIDECVLLDSSDELVTSLKNSTIADLTLVQLGDADLSATFLIA